MEIYVFRHGIAEISGPGQLIPRGALTDEGQKKVAEVVLRAARVSSRR